MSIAQEQIGHETQAAVPSPAEAPQGAALTAYLRALPRLRYRAGSTPVPCKLCGAAAEPFCEIDFNVACNGAEMFDRANVLVPYVRCVSCDFLFTTFCDAWSTRDFGDLIYNDDYILVDGEYDGTRARRDAVGMAGLLSGAKALRLLDYGSGLGHFARAMADHGFERIENYDPFSSPARPEGRFDIITSFETIEHSAHPDATIRDMLSLMKKDGCLLIGQTLQPRDIEEQAGKWWYLGPRNGHVSTFSEATIRGFANREGLIFDNFGGLFALSFPQRSAYLAGFLGPRALPSHQTILYAPPASAPTGGWHGVESPGTLSFRWTGAAEVSLGDVVLDRETQFVVPFVNVITPEYLDRMHLRVGETLLPLRRRHERLLADHAPVQTGTVAVSLVTPTPIAPCDLGHSPDVRPLGLAVSCAPEAPLNPVRRNRWSGRAS